MMMTQEDKRSMRYRRYFGSIPFAMLPLVVALLSIERPYFYQLPLAVQCVVVGLAFASALYLVGVVALPWSRPLWLTSNLYDPTHWWGFLLPVANTLYIACMATSGWAVLSAFLYLQGLATMSPERALAKPINDSLMYYFWSFLDAVPVLELPRTLGWELPFRYTDPVNRVLLLLYKIVLIGPVIATGVLVWQDIRRLRSGTKEPA
jgi:hypothetical protein